MMGRVALSAIEIPPEQVGVDLVRRCRLARVRSLIDRHPAGEPHQTPDPFAVDDMALGRQTRLPILVG